MLNGCADELRVLYLNQSCDCASDSWLQAADQRRRKTKIRSRCTPLLLRAGLWQVGITFVHTGARRIYIPPFAKTSSAKSLPRAKSMGWSIRACH